MQQISSLQFFIMIFSSVVANGILSAPQVAAGIGGPGGWVMVLLYGLLATVSLIILVKLMERFPTDNYITVTQQLTGRVGGYIIGLLLITQATLASATVVRGMAGISTSTMFQQTPAVVLISIMIFLSMFVLYHGIEVLARVNIILFTLKLLVILLILVLALPNAKMANLQPLWYRGGDSWVTGTLGISSSYLGVLIVPFIFKSVNNKKRLIYNAAGAMVTIIIVYALFTVLVIATFGSNETARMLWPTMYMVRELPIPMEPVFAAVWLTSAFSVTSATLYVAAYAMKCLFKLTDYRTILLPLSIIVITIANTPANQLDVIAFVLNVSYLGILLEWLLPMMLLILAVVFKKGKS